MALTDGLVSYYKLDGNSNDSVGSNNGTDSNISYVTGKINQGASFNGSSSIISLGNNFNFDYNQDFSLGMWFIPNNDSAEMDMLTKWNQNGGFPFAIRLNAGGVGNIYFARYDTINNPSIISSTTFVGGNLYFLVATKNGSTLSLYINNNTTDTNTDTTTSSTTNSTNVLIGNRSIGSYYYNGIVDELFFYNRALTASERTTLWNNGAGLSYPFVTTQIITTQSKARIQTVATKTIQSKGDIKKSAISTIQTKGRIKITATESIQAKSRIQLPVIVNTIQSKANIISKNIPKSLQVKTDIKNTVISDIKGKGRIQKIGINTIQVGARLKRIELANIQAKARIDTQNIPKTIQSKANIEQTIAKNIKSKARIATSLTKSLQAKAKIWAFPAGYVKMKRSNYPKTLNDNRKI